jgi:hypothetical protein
MLVEERTQVFLKHTGNVPYIIVIEQGWDTSAHLPAQ